MKAFRRKFVGLLAGLVGIGLGHRASAIVIATGPSGAGSTSLFDGVGTLTFPTKYDPATVTLIDDNHVLTAAHAVFGVPVGKMLITFGGNTYSVSNVATPAAYVGGNPTSSTTNGVTTRDYTSADKADIAVLTLRGIVSGVTPWSYNHGTVNESTAGNATIIGYGNGGDGTNGETPGTFGTRRLATNQINVVTTTLTNQTVTETNGNKDILPNSVIGWDFNKNDGSTGPLGDTATGPNEGDIANGDSGAPVFQINPSTGQYVINGIAIDGTNNTSFGEISWATRTADYATFIASAVPEPTSLTLVALSAAMLLARRRQTASEL